MALTFQFGSCGKSQTQEPEVKEVVKETSVDISTHELRHKEMMRIYNRLDKIRKSKITSYDTEVVCMGHQLYILNMLNMQE